MKGDWRFGRRALYASSALARLAGTCLGAVTAQAQDATWLLNPGSGDFNTAANWTPATVPAGAATFAQSNATTLTFSASIAVNTLQFNAGAPAYTFNLSSQFVNIAGTGVVNNSSNAPTFNGPGFLEFDNAATAGNAIINNAPGLITFADSSTAGTATITNSFGALLSFTNFSTAGSAVITTNFGSQTLFTANSTGGNAQLITDGSSTVDFSGTAGPSSDNKFTAGSIAGAGSHFLGAGQLTVGGNGLSTTVSGVIADGASSGGGGTGASLVKVGNGTLTLAGVNTYSGGTTANDGTGAVTGTFSGLPEGATVNAGGFSFKISYVGGDGNDVTLEALVTPVPTLSEWAQFGMALVLAGIAVWYLKRRRDLGTA